MPRPTTLSVLVPNFNHGTRLRESLNAILDQSYQTHEIIVADDCSTDDSVDVVEEIARRSGRVRLIRNQRNLGPVGNSNRLLELATGEYVYFASADDRVLPGLFEQSMQMLSRYPEAGLCSSQARLIDEAGKDRGQYQSRLVAARPTFVSAAESQAALQQHGNWIVGCTLFMRRQAVVDAGGFIEELGPFIDGFTQQVIALRSGACFIPHPLACWRVTATGYSVSQSRNTEAYLSQLAHMVRLMRTEYADLFSETYVASYERECLYGAAASAGLALEGGVSVYVARVERALSPTTVADRALLRLLNLSVRLQARFVTAYVFLRRRRITLEMVRRRLRWLAGLATNRLRRPID